MLPLVILLIYNDLYAVNLIYNQVTKSYEDLLSQHMLQVDLSLDILDKYFSSVLASDYNFKILNEVSKETSYVTAVYNLSTRLSQDILGYRLVDVIFAYFPSREDFIYAYSSSNRNYPEREEVKNYLLETINTKDNLEYYLNADSWLPVRIGNQYYFIRLYKFDNSYVGGWIKVQNLLITALDDEEAVILTTDDGIQLASSKVVTVDPASLENRGKRLYFMVTKDKYLQVNEDSTKGPFKIILLIPTRKILARLPYLERINTILVFVSIMLIPLSLVIIRKIVIIPLESLMNAMKKVRDGAIQTHIDSCKTSNEFKIVNETFNEMIDQIRNLKINI